ncbi:MAG: glycoside hydrolase family 15 protein [Actinomycetota bacterium]
MGGSYAPISDYGFIGDCHSAALVSRDGSIDWCCLPRIDSASSFGRILDAEKGGFFQIAPENDEHEIARRYLDDTLVLETTFRSDVGEARLLDCFVMREGGRHRPRREILRVLEGISGEMEFVIRIEPRFDYGLTLPQITEDGTCHVCIGGSQGVLIGGDPRIHPDGRHSLTGRVTVREGERSRLSIRFREPHVLDAEEPAPPTAEEIDRSLEQTIEWWRTWSARGSISGPRAEDARRSAIVLKALTHAPSGAIAAAATTSLPAALGAKRNWDYRYSWIRDSIMGVRALGRLGHVSEAGAFRRFVQRAASGSAENLQVLYGVEGERLLHEIILDHLEGYRGTKPVRIGNAAFDDVQHDQYGELLDLAWRAQQGGRAPDSEYWRFLVEIVETAIDLWPQPDQGIWEIRGEPLHFVHSKVMCWAAVDRGIRLAEACSLDAPLARWTKTRDEIRATVEDRGFDRDRGVFIAAFENPAMDAALLFLPAVGFVEYGDERMVRTADAIREELVDNGLIRRYLLEDVDDGLEGREGAFICCTFWLAECLAYQKRFDEAREVFDQGATAANDLGLFSEGFDPERGEMLGNFPQALSHLSHIAAIIALESARDG